MMSNHTVQAAAEGLPKFTQEERIVSACTRFVESGDETILLDVIDERAPSLRSVQAKAAALSRFTAKDLRTSEVGRSLAVSIAEDFREIEQPYIDPPLAPVTGSRETLEAYSEWLAIERRILCKQLYPGIRNAEQFIPCNTLASDYHVPMLPKRWQDQPLPASRAASVLAHVGVDLENPFQKLGSVANAVVAKAVGGRV
jgi:hypothetical protein